MSRPLALSLLLCGSVAAGNLNRIAIHYQYADGDFPAVIRSIDGFTQGRAAWSREDSAFIAKHLGVVYAAGPETRERGKYHLLRLLELDPGDELADMYVSDEIHDLYQRLRKENEAHLRELAARRAAEGPARAPAWRKPWVWATAAGVMTAGVTTAIILSSHPGNRPEYVVP